MKKFLVFFLTLGSLSSYAADPVYLDGSIGINTGDSTLGVNTNFGYMFDRYFAVEAGFTGGNNYFMYDGAVKGILPLNNIVDLYGKLGVGINNYNGLFSNSSVGLLYGGGIAFHIAPKWQLHVEDYTVSGANPNFLMFGGQYNF